MKFYETHFEEYINEIHKYNLHPKLEKIYNTFPSKIEDFKNMIFYGPSGTGKYSQMLYAIRKYSNTDLKYERKLRQGSGESTYAIEIANAIGLDREFIAHACHSRTKYEGKETNVVSTHSPKRN